MSEGDVGHALGFVELEEDERLVADVLDVLHKPVSLDAKA